MSDAPYLHKIFLHGGGDSEASRQETFGRFLGAMPEGLSDKLALIIVADSEDDFHENERAYRAIFTKLGFPAENISPIYATETEPLTYEKLAAVAPSGLFVCGGVTPAYHRALCNDLSWLAYLQETGVPYGGTSAGAAIAADNAIVGGWQATRQAQTRDILFVGASEGVDPLTVKQGLGIVPFTVDVHASQMGTLTRLIHAVELGLVDEGWGIDENTMLLINGRNHTIHGQGHCYRVWRDSDAAVRLQIYTAMDTIAQ